MAEIPQKLTQLYEALRKLKEFYELFQRMFKSNSIVLSAEDVSDRRASQVALKRLLRILQQTFKDDIGRLPQPNDEDIREIFSITPRWLDMDVIEKYFFVYEGDPASLMSASFHLMRIFASKATREGITTFVVAFQMFIMAYLRLYYQPTSRLQFVYLCHRMKPTIYPAYDLTKFTKVRLFLPFSTRIKVVPPYLLLYSFAYATGHCAVIGIDDAGNFFCHWLPRGVRFEDIRTEQDVRRAMGFDHHIYEVERLEEGRWYRVQGDLRMAIVKVPMKKIYDAIQVYKVTEKVISHILSYTPEQLYRVARENARTIVIDGKQYLYSPTIIEVGGELKGLGEKPLISSHYISYIDDFLRESDPAERIRKYYLIIEGLGSDLPYIIETAISKGYLTPRYDQRFQELLGLLYSYNTRVEWMVGNHRIIVRNGIYVYDNTTPISRYYFFDIIEYAFRAELNEQVIRWLTDGYLTEVISLIGFLLLEPATIDFKHPEHRDVTIKLDKSPSEAILVLFTTLSIHVAAPEIRWEVELREGRAEEEREATLFEDVTEMFKPLFKYVVGRSFLSTWDVADIICAFYPSPMHTKLHEVMAIYHPIPVEDMEYFTTALETEKQSFKECGAIFNGILCGMNVLTLDGNSYSLVVIGSIKVTPCKGRRLRTVMGISRVLLLSGAKAFERLNRMLKERGYADIRDPLYPEDSAPP